MGDERGWWRGGLSPADSPNRRPRGSHLVIRRELRTQRFIRDGRERVPEIEKYVSDTKVDGDSDGPERGGRGEEEKENDPVRYAPDRHKRSPPPERRPRVVAEPPHPEVGDNVKRPGNHREDGDYGEKGAELQIKVGAVGADLNCEGERREGDGAVGDLLRNGDLPAADTIHSETTTIIDTYHKKN